MYKSPFFVTAEGIKRKNKVTERMTDCSNTATQSLLRNKHVGFVCSTPNLNFYNYNSLFIDSNYVIRAKGILLNEVMTGNLAVVCPHGKYFITISVRPVFGKRACNFILLNCSLNHRTPALLRGLRSAPGR